MRIFNGSNFREITPSELKEMERSAKVTSLEQRNSPMTDGEVLRLLLAQQINTIKVDDNTSMRMIEFYPVWTAGMQYATGFTVSHGNKLWRCLQGHTSQTDWKPENSPTLWEKICLSYTGTIDDPIPYDGNMTLKNGKYYIQCGVVYLCNRDSISPVYNALSSLVGQYVEVIL